MARPEFLAQLPSLDELLEHPRVAAAIQQFDKSTAITQVRTAVASLTAEVARRAEELTSVNASELLETLVRRLEVPRPQVAAGPINASGRLFGPEVGRLPLPPAAFESCLAAAGSYQPKRTNTAASIATELLDCGSAYVLSNAATALEAVIETLAGGGHCVVARGDMTELGPGVRLDQLCRRSGATLHEVGAVDSISTEDFRSALAACPPSSEAPRVILVRGKASLSLAEMASLASEVGAELVVDCGTAPPRNDTPAFSDRLPSVQNAIDSGANLVVFDAAGRTGGPVAGVVASDAERIEKLSRSTLAKRDSIDPMIDAALASTLALFTQPHELRFTHPLYQLLDAPIENLKQRAERIAPQLAEAEQVVQALPVEIESAWRQASWGIRLELSEPIDQLLQDEVLLGSPVEGGGLVVDLATVFPSQDRNLVEAFVPAPAKSCTESV